MNILKPLYMYIFDCNKDSTQTHIQLSIHQYNISFARMKKVTSHEKNY